MEGLSNGRLYFQHVVGSKPTHPLSLPPNDAPFLLIFLHVQHAHMHTCTQRKTHTTSARKVQTARNFRLFRPLPPCVRDGKAQNNESLCLLKWCLTNGNE